MQFEQSFEGCVLHIHMNSCEQLFVVFEEYVRHESIFSVYVLYVVFPLSS